MPDSKVVERIRKLFAIAEGVANDANSDELKESMANEATAAAAMAEKLLFKYKLSRADVIPVEEEEEFVEEIINVFGMTIVPDFIKRSGARAPSVRKIWFEELAKVVAEGYFCKAAPRPLTKEVVFYGLDMDREIAVYVFQRLAESANELSKIEWKKAAASAGAINFETFEEVPHIEEEVFMWNFHRGFREQLRENFINRMDEEPDDAKKVFEKAKEETADYFNSVRSRLEEFPYGVETAEKCNRRIEENSWAINIGKKIALRVSARMSSMENNAEAIQTTEKKLASPEVYILIDKSGSMSGSKIDQAKRGAVDYATQAVNKGYAVGVISFGWRAQVEIEPQKEIGLSWHNAVSKIKVSGSTNLTEAIDQAKTRFKSRRQKRIICVITDGMPDNRESALKSATEAKKMGIEIFAIGTDDADQEFLDQLASMEGIKVVAGELRQGIRSMAGLLPAANGV